MILSPMRFKDYVWPHNPRIYEIEYRRPMASHKVPFGLYVLQSMGRTNRVLSGEGEFCGEGAYDEFKRLANVFYDNTPGLLIHPLWQDSKAWFVSLRVTQEPKVDYVSYSFEFWDMYEGYSEGLKQTVRQVSDAPGTADEMWHTVVSGDTMWGIAVAAGLSLARLLELNPQVKNPNLIYPGDKIRTG